MVANSYNGAEAFTLSEPPKKRFRREGYMSLLASSPDGSQIVICQGKQVLRLDAHSGELTGKSIAATPHSEFWHGELVVLVSRSDIAFHSAKTFKLRERFERAGVIKFAALSRDGSRMLFGVDKNVHLWDRQANKELFRIRVDKSGVFSGFFEAGEDRAFVCGNQDMKVLDLVKKKPKPIAWEPAGEPWLALPLPDRRHVVTAGADHALRVLRLEDGACIVALEGHLEEDRINRLACAQNGRIITSCAGDRTARIWTLQSYGD